ncbi:MAG TPA: pilin, partial [bacterium]|nr:pilin [bacterium]
YMVSYSRGDAGCKKNNVNTPKCCGTCTTHDLKSAGAARCLVSCNNNYPEHDGGGDQYCTDGKKCCYMPASVTPQTPSAGPSNNEKPVESSLPHFSSLITATPTATIGNVIRTLLGLAGSLTIIMMTYAGILWMTAGGKEKRVTQAKNIIVWTVIGLVLIFTSYTVVNFILTTVVPSS